MPADQTVLAAESSLADADAQAFEQFPMLVQGLAVAPLRGGAKGGRGCRRIVNAPLSGGERPSFAFNGAVGTRMSRPMRIDGTSPQSRASSAGFFESPKIFPNSSTVHVGGREFL